MNWDLLIVCLYFFILFCAREFAHAQDKEKLGARFDALVRAGYAERADLLAEQRKERADLCQRITAPQQAAITHAVTQGPEIVAPIAWDDDDDAYQAKKALNESA